jgi:predicted nuclease of predicted toxin-antitoxin system
MKLLLDANLSWRLIKQLKSVFTEVYHVNQIGLPLPPTDTKIWNWAKTNQAIIVTSDEDFFNLLSKKGFPPKVVLLRVGNQSTQNIAGILIRHYPQIESLQNSDEHGLLEIV